MKGFLRTSADNKWQRGNDGIRQRGGKGRRGDGRWGGSVQVQPFNVGKLTVRKGGLPPLFGPIGGSRKEKERG
jgi:hypothetical protein